MSHDNKLAQQFLERIENRSCVVAIVGLGYVGLPMVRAFHDAGFRVIGYDTDQRKLDMLSRGETYLEHLGSQLARDLAKSDRFHPTGDPKDLGNADAVLLCVPTPLGRHNEPDLSFVTSSTDMVAQNLRAGQLVVLESTTYPGTTREEMLPLLEARDLRCGRDFFLAYSPEREDPGRLDASTKTTPKLVGGIDEISGQLAHRLYCQVVREVHLVATAEVAEAAKLLENIYRAVNIALVNELKTVFTDMGIDIWDVIAAASTKPFGFQAFYPGPGLGGHCIPIDPFYLTWKAKEHGHSTRFIELAGEVNRGMPHFVVARTVSALNDAERALRGASVMIIGVAYKPNINDVRESPAAEIIELLLAGGAKLSYHDPHVPEFPKMRMHDIDLRSTPLSASLLAEQDVVVVVTHHACVDWKLIGEHARLVVDTRNVMNPATARARIVKA